MEGRMNFRMDDLKVSRGTILRVTCLVLLTLIQHCKKKKKVCYVVEVCEVVG